ncbi:PQQ-binding-like beta-propeller repeat protein [uncultured Arthrobacter sp.]|uniref:outer membrane protein assembly factor BamB family protein n=1 Tax=uncultured Arthrobacter sp. TaxID=114050 RepID=UPI0032179ED3
MKRVWSCVLVLAGLAGSSFAGPNWPAFRGPAGDGHSDAAALPLRWAEGKNVVWKTPIPGRGASTPIIWGDQIFLITAVKTDREIEQPPEPEPTPEQPMNPFKIQRPKNFYQFVVMAVDRRTGATRWQHLAKEEVPHEGHHNDASFASSSPMTDGKNLYVNFGSRGVYCYDLAGNQKWSRDLGKMLIFNYFGEGCSPVVHGGRVFVQQDSEDVSYLTALDAKTGKRLWHFQAVKHDLWDWDLPAAPTLVTVKRNGRMVDAVAQITKTGYVYVFERSTGKPLFPIAYRRVPASTMDGERAATTQPYPVAPRPFVRQTLTEAMLTRRTPAAHDSAVKFFRAYRTRGMYEPPNTRGTIIFPGVDGGGEWGGAAFDPATGLFIVSARDAYGIWFTKEEHGAYGWAGADYGVGGRGYIRALDYRTGKLRWQHPIGGGSGAGVLTTTTGVTFTGDGSGNALGLRTSDGATLWHAAIGGVNNSPVMIELDGRRLLANHGAAVGIGMGQVNRLDSCKLAVERANSLGVSVDSDVDGAGGAAAVQAEPGASGAPERARGAVAASDAFFPFADGLQILIDAGVRAVVQPGGSVRDEEVIAAANAAGITMYFTGARHFFH